MAAGVAEPEPLIDILEFNERGTLLVVLILYRREFHSEVLGILRE